MVSQAYWFIFNPQNLDNYRNRLHDGIMKKLIYLLIILFCCIFAACDESTPSIPDGNNTENNTPDDQGAGNSGQSGTGNSGQAGSPVTPILPEGSEDTPIMTIDQLRSLFSMDVGDIGIAINSETSVTQSIKPEYRVESEAEYAAIYADYSKQKETINKEFQDGSISQIEMYQKLDALEVDLTQKREAYSVKWKNSKVWEDVTYIFTVTNTTSQDHSFQYIFCPKYVGDQCKVYMTDPINVPANASLLPITVKMKTYGDNTFYSGFVYYNIIK